MPYWSILCALLSLTAWTEQADSSLQVHKNQLENLSGTYEDPSPYPYGAAFGKRTFTFESGTWTLDFKLGLDPKLEFPVFRFRTHGRYEVLDPSTTVEGAFNALFYEDQKFLTLLTDHPELITAFGLDQCALTPHIEQNISKHDCALWAAVESCHEDHDLLMVDEAGLLYFGIRPADNNMCSPDRRPAALTPGVKKL
ncbi:MAG: hypothetical protein AAFV80_21355 [Bacteroidota bacterium]